MNPSKCRRFGSSDQRNPRILYHFDELGGGLVDDKNASADFDGERFLRDEVDGARREDTVPFCSKSDSRAKNEPLRPHPLGEDPAEG